MRPKPATKRADLNFDAIEGEIPQVEAHGRAGEAGQIADAGLDVVGRILGEHHRLALDGDPGQGLGIRARAFRLGDHQADPGIRQNVLGVVGQGADVDVEGREVVRHGIGDH